MQHFNEAVSIAKYFGINFKLRYSECDNTYSAEFDGSAKGEWWIAEDCHSPEIAIERVTKKLLDTVAPNGKTYREMYQ